MSIKYFLFILLVSSCLTQSLHPKPIFPVLFCSNGRIFLPFFVDTGENAQLEMNWIKDWLLGCSLLHTERLIGKMQQTAANSSADDAHDAYLDPIVLKASLISKMIRNWKIPCGHRQNCDQLHERLRLSYVELLKPDWPSLNMKFSCNNDTRSRGTCNFTAKGTHEMNHSNPIIMLPTLRPTCW